MKTNALLFSLILIISSLAGCFGDSDESEEQDIDSIIQEIDSDNDGILNSVDLCPDTVDDERQMVDSSGCYDEDSFLDSDNDGVANNKDECPDSPETEPVFLNGCSITQLDFDKDGVIDTLDQCPNSPPDVATMSDGCIAGEIPSSVAVRIVAEPIQNYKFYKPTNSMVFGFNNGLKYTTNIGPFTTDVNNQLVIGTIHNDEFQSPEDGHLMIHYTSEQLIENVPGYISTLTTEVDGGFGGLFYNSTDGDGFTNYTLEYYIWSVPLGVNKSFFDIPTNNSLIGTEVCDQPPIDETMFSMPNGDIHNLSLYQFAGKVLVLEIGAEWCGPCQEVLQEMKELNSMTPFRNKIQFLSMSMENDDRGDMSVEEARARQIAEAINFPVSGTNELGEKWLDGPIPIILIFTIDPSRNLNLVTVSKTIGLDGLELFDTLVEVDHLFSGEYAAELCKSYVAEEIEPYDGGDNDGDGVVNSLDAFPEDPEEQYDLDNDGIGNNADFDDDGDGVSDVIDLCPQTQMANYSEIFSILYEDGCADLDGDKYNSTIDCNDLNASLHLDSDGDSYCDQNDDFPNDITEWIDSDGDGVGDNSDLFPNDDTYQSDNDGDGVLESNKWWAAENDRCPNSTTSHSIGSDGCEDLDGDGFGFSNDCDDNDSEINPDADEIEDTIDNNCNGIVDEGYFLAEIHSVEFNSSIIYNYEEELECKYNYSIQYEDFTSINIYWYINGVYLWSHDTNRRDTESNILPLTYIQEWGIEEANLEKGDIITCIVYVNSLWNDSISLHNQIVVSNSPPELGGVLLNQLNNGTIVCEVWGSSDLDGDDITFSYQWFIDGELSTVTNSYLMSSDYTFSEGDDVTCIVTPHDGEDAGLPVSKTITMEIMPEDEEQD